jgi:transcriptional regulator of arginine metabolism
MSRTYAAVGREKRLEMIREALSASPVASHSALASTLSQQGVYVTQATLSRDLTALCAVRTRTTDGLRYVIPDHGLLHVDREEAARLIIELLPSGSTVVIRTLPDSARAVADALSADPASSSLIAGCVADRDVVFAAVRSPHTAGDLVAVLERRYDLLPEPDEG